MNNMTKVGITHFNDFVSSRRHTSSVVVFVVTTLIVGCNASDSSPNGAMHDVIGNASASTKFTTPSEWPDHYALGQTASPELIMALDTDVDTTGAGLPDGRGTADEGAPIYRAKCAGCHGPKGEGIKPFPALIQPIAANDSFPWAKNGAAPKTIGNYWPFATTYFGYIRHAMPQSAPGSLAPDEVYQLVAYLLTENHLLPPGAIMNKQTLPQVKLPMRKRLILDTRRGGAEVR